MKQRAVLSPWLDELTHWGELCDNNDCYAVVVVNEGRNHYLYQRRNVRTEEAHGSFDEVPVLACVSLGTCSITANPGIAESVLILPRIRWKGYRYQNIA